MLAAAEAQVQRRRGRPRERAAAPTTAHAGPRATADRLAAGARPGPRRLRRRPGQARRAQQAGRGAARRGGPGALQRRAGRRAAQPGADNQHMAGGRRRAADARPTSASPTPRSTRRSTASSTCARRAPGEYVTPGQPIVTLSIPTISGCAPTSRRPTSTACARRHAHRAPALGRRAPGHGLLSAASMPPSPRSAT